MIPLLLLFACQEGDAYIVEGTVLEVRPSEVLLDHAPIEGFMDAMTMPFKVKSPVLLEGVTPGDRVLARLIVTEEESWLAAMRVTGHIDLAKAPLAVGGLPPMPYQPGDAVGPYEVEAADGSVVRIGPGQPPTAVAFLYTRCPIPEFCPATVSRLQALQDALAGKDARLVAITLDPAYDTREVLAAFADTSSARAPGWVYGRLPEKELREITWRAGMHVEAIEGGDIAHGVRWLVLDRDGKLVERYDDHAWPAQRVVDQLLAGK